MEKSETMKAAQRNALLAVRIAMIGKGLDVDSIIHEAEQNLGL